jgi:hypothetical protein
MEIVIPITLPQAEHSENKNGIKGLILQKTNQTYDLAYNEEARYR